MTGPHPDNWQEREQEAYRLFRAGELTKADAIALSLLEQYQSYWLLRFKAIISFRRRHLDEALQYIDAAIAIAPANPEAHETRIEVLIKLGRNEEIIQSCDELLRLAPDSARALKIKEETSETLGKTDLMRMFDRITIVNVDGRPGDLLDTQRALQHSALQMPGARCLLLSVTPPSQLLPPIEHIQIAPMGHLEYSLFITYALHQFIETDYALIVQNDGWVLNGASFSKDFLEFDYIGAPTGLADILENGDRSYVRHFSWAAREAAREPGVKINYSMNGGFSLRSKKFLKTPSLLKLEYRLRPPEVKQKKNGYQMQWPAGDAWEDVYHCVINRAAMDEAGIRFPPLGIGARFALEHLNPIVHAGMDVSKTFGHHMGARRLISTDPLVLRYVWTESEVRSIVMESDVIAAFEKMGYRVEFGG